jgi:aminomethyltransferase
VSELHHSPLEAAHRALGAKLVPFGGWNMPLQYGDGTVAEHRACRERAVAFDVSHLGTVRVTGDGALATLQAAFTNDLGRIAPGRAQYTHLLDPGSGGVLDDIIVWWVEEDRFDVMPNASNTDGVVAAIGGTDVTTERAVIAVQGPMARELLDPVAPDAARIGRFAVGRFTFDGVECVVAGTGYTGEDGVECAVPRQVAEAFWEAVMEAGIPPAGLGARDTLRLEAGLPLHGHELGPTITPFEAGLGWVVRMDKPEFRGKGALEAQRAAGLTRTLRGLRCEGRRPPRADNDVLVDGQVVGTVTSGNFSPVLGVGIAMAFLPVDTPDGEAVVIDVRGAEVAATVVPMPFVRRT